MKGAARWLLGGSACCALLLGMVAACALDLDESKLDVAHASRDAGASDARAPVDAGTDGAQPVHDAGAPGCVTDSDCVSSQACRVGRCAPGGSCVFDVCPAASTCSASSCIADACTPPLPYGFHAATITVDSGPVGCNGNPATCIAAAWPFVFVGTDQGVVAYAVNDPSRSSPPVVPVLGVPFVPARITSLGRRIYFIGPVVGSGPTWRVPLAWVDCPSDPLATSIQAVTAFDTLTESSIGAAWETTAGALLLANTYATSSFALAQTSAPLTDGASLTFFPSPGITPSASLAVPSGDRLVVARNDPSTYTTYFSLETAPASLDAQNAGEQSTLAAMGPTAAQAAYAQGDDGSVLWNTATVVLGGGGTPQLASTRFAWLVSGESSMTFDPSAHLDLEVYDTPQPFATPLAGPVAWLDSSDALVLAAAHEIPSETSVQVATRAPSPALVAGQRSLIAAPVGSVGVVASNGFGYVLESDATGGLEVLIFAPGCPM